MRAQQACWLILLSAAPCFTSPADWRALAADQGIIRSPLPPIAARPSTGRAQTLANRAAATSEAPETTGSLPKTGSPAANVTRPLANSAAAPAIAPRPAPALASPPVAITGTQATPAAVPPPPTLADFIQRALIPYAAQKSAGRDAAEMRSERAAVVAFYAGRNYAPLWIEKGAPTEAARAAMARLAHAGDDGLDLAALPAPAFADGDPALANAEIALSTAVVAYARQASGSRIDPARLSNSIGARPQLADPAKVLSTVAAAGANAGTALEGFNPPQPGYRALRDKLAELRREMPEALNLSIPRGPTLRPGMSDPRVPLIRARFGLDASIGSAADHDLTYDTRIAAAVAEFQKTYGLPVSGTFTARTLNALSSGAPARIENELIANMEFWRWMPRDMSKERVEVNVPDFSVTLTRDNEIVWRNKVIVGKPKTPTPIFSDAIRYLIVNPIWNVPPSIIRKEMLPRLRQDPNYLARQGFEAFYRNGRLVVRQMPGERNALGRIKFVFPNRYAVYLHDTPNRRLFAARQRAFSHGCVRVDEPFGLAEALLGDPSRWSQARLQRLIGGGQRYVYLPRPLPIYVEYFTAFVDADGRLQRRDDLYGYTEKVEAALGLQKGRG